MSPDAMTGPAGAAERDPFDPRLALAASGALREFNRAGVLAAADVHVARRLGTLHGEEDERVLLAVALAVRAPRIGHVLVDLATIRATAAVDTDDPVNLDALRWPEPAEWVDAVTASPLVAPEPTEPPAEDADPEVSAPPTDPAPDPVSARPLRLRGTWLYLDRYWAEELAVARALRTLLDSEVPDVDAPALQNAVANLFPGEPDGRQAAAAQAALRRRCAVIAGGPGTGKTTTVARIAALLAIPGVGGPPGRPPLLALTAPTGKAAARLQESVHAEAATLDVAPEVRSALQALPASTIHRLLGWRPGSSSRFRHDAERRLPHDVVIVDETSMVSLSLMARLIEALRTDARLVLVGDPGQLASIEAGAVLGDIVGEGSRGGEPTPDATVATGATADETGRRPGPAASPSIVMLDRGHRFGGAIAALAGAIRRGDGDAVMELLRASGDGDGDELEWIDGDPARAQTPAAVRAGAVTAARAVVDAARAGDGAEALAALGAFRILCAHRRGPAGVAGWTARVEGWLAEDVADLAGGERWYVGRPLLVTENDHELGLNNGDTGVVIAAGEGRVMASFERAGSPALYSPSRLGAVETVYAMTIHKSQGSQFEAVAVLLPEPDSRLLTRELLYTAATRARRRLILVGPEATIRAAVARPVARASGLAARLWS